jgi:hypothetical protein
MTVLAKNHGTCRTDSRVLWLEPNIVDFTFGIGFGFDCGFRLEFGFVCGFIFVFGFGFGFGFCFECRFV